MPNKKCFVIGPIGGDDSKERRHANDLFDYLIRPVVETEEFGYTASRADKMQTPGQITTQVIQAVAQSDLVIADLSFRNPNAFYELSLRHALGAPVIHMIWNDDEIPFDVHDYRAIKFEFHVAMAQRAKEELVGQLRSIQSFEPQNPIFDTLGKIDLERSEDPEARAQAKLMDMMSEVRHELRSLNNALRHQRMQDSFDNISMSGDRWQEITSAIGRRPNEMSSTTLKELMEKFDILDPDKSPSDV